MKIIADSGSTKCTWLVTDGVHTSEYRTRGIDADVRLAVLMY